jgi:hypothetical protein
MTADARELGNAAQHTCQEDTACCIALSGDGQWLRCLAALTISKPDGAGRVAA